MSQKDYVTSSVGARLLGVNTGKFFYYVKSGKISKEPGGKKRNKGYSVKDILEVKQKIDSKSLKKTPHGYVDWIEPGDIGTCLKLDYLVYPGEVLIADPTVYIARLKKNSRTGLAVYDSPEKNRMFAYINLLPLPEAVIHEILRGERHESEITAQEVETYDRKGEYFLLVESAVVDPNHRDRLNALLRGLTSFWCDQYPDRTIRKIYAQAETKEGDVLIQKLFFAPREDLAHNAYVLDLARPGASRFIKNFQRCLEEKRQALSID